MSKSGPGRFATWSRSPGYGGEIATALLITADDYGYSPRYNAGILRAAHRGAIDAASAMVTRPWCDPAPLLASGVEVGLHLELIGEARVDHPLGQPRRERT